MAVNQLEKKAEQDYYNFLAAYITVHRTGLNPLPQVKLGKTLNLRCVFLTKMKVDPES